MKRTVLLIGASLIALIACAVDPAAILKQITEFRTSQIAKARQENKPLDAASLNAEVEKMAKGAVAGQDVEKITPSDGLSWAQLYQMAKDYKSACRSAELFLSTKPDGQPKFNAQMIMLNSCNELGEAKMLVELIKNFDSNDPMHRMSLATSTAFTYSETVHKKLGLDEAIKLLDLSLDRLKVDVTTEGANQARAKGAFGSVSEAKAELLADAKRDKEALKTLDDAILVLGVDKPESRSLRGAKTRMALIGNAAPAIASERAYGEFGGLSSLKGKVVIVDFFAHWCGPCIRSFPDMKQLYSDLKPKGLEIVGLTTYYGYYKTENREKRDMVKETEFAKMGEFIKEHDLPWPVVYGERTNFDAYGVTGIPHVAVIDKAGTVHKIKVGYSPESFKEFRAEVEKMLK